MKQIYIVVEGGCVRYVSTNSQQVINEVGVTVLDLDDLADDPTDLAEKADDLKVAKSATRIW